MIIEPTRVRISILGLLNIQAQLTKVALSELVMKVILLRKRCKAKSYKKKAPLRVRNMLTPD